MNDADITIYPQPRLRHLAQHAGADPQQRRRARSIVEYLKTPPGRAKLVELIAAMGMPVRELLRAKGTPYDELEARRPDTGPTTS